MYVVATIIMYENLSFGPHKDMHNIQRQVKLQRSRLQVHNSEGNLCLCHPSSKGLGLNPPVSSNYKLY